MRFSETPISETDERHSPTIATVEGSVASDGRSTVENASEVKPNEGSGSPEARTRASELIRSIGTEFSRLREKNRSGAWADLEDKIAKAGDILVSSGMISSKDWVGMLIDIEQFRKSETGSTESPGDALAKWLSEGIEPVAIEKPKRVKKVKV